MADTDTAEPLAESATLSRPDRSVVCVLPLRNTDPGTPSELKADARASQPSFSSFNPPTRPSVVPSHAIGSIMPGASMYLHSALLSAVAGYVDAAGFASLIGLFPAHMTGEIVGDAIALSSGHPGDHVTRLWMLPVFVGSVSIATLVARLLRRNGRRALTGLLALVTAALAAFSASDFLSGLLHESWHLHMLLGGGCAVAAMGFQNALMRESLSGSCPTTVMTGNLTHVVIDVVDHLFSKLSRPNKRDRRPHSRLLPVASALFAFIGCAVLGGFLTRFFGSLSVLLPDRIDRGFDRACLARRSKAARRQHVRQEHGCGAAADVRRLAPVARARRCHSLPTTRQSHAGAGDTRAFAQQARARTSAKAHRLRHPAEDDLHQRRVTRAVPAQRVPPTAESRSRSTP